LAIGDFNTCRPYLDEAGAIDPTAYYMDKIERIGFCDLWRRRYPAGREFSWFSTRGNGFRIDHAFLSLGLAARTGSISYSHEERIAGALRSLASDPRARSLMSRATPGTDPARGRGNFVGGSERKRLPRAMLANPSPAVDCGFDSGVWMPSDPTLPGS